MSNAKKRTALLPYLLTPFLLLMLTGGILMLAWSLAPSHQIETYLSIAFMDNLKTSSKNDGLNIIENAISTEHTGETGNTEGEIQFPKFGEQYAVMQAEAIELEVPVFYGSNTELLKRGACQSTQSAVIGDKGNTIIDAHVNTYFAKLSQLKTGDTVVLYTNYGRFTYTVTEEITFSKDNKQYLTTTEEDCLTLYTCRPQVLGSSDIRIGVRCALTETCFY